jgi:AcrR family transcriptional regulator
MATTRRPKRPTEADGVKSWRDRSVERSLQNALAKAQSRSDRFIRSAEQIMLETGSSDFTVQEVVERAKTSLRSFYQHFNNREELLLAVFEELLRKVSADIQQQVDATDDPLEGLRTLLRHTTGSAGSPRGQLLNRAFSDYHRQLAKSNPAEYARILMPLYEVVVRVVQRGVDFGTFRTDVKAESMALLMTQTLLAGGQMYALGAEIGHGEINVDAVFEFFACGLIGHKDQAAAPATKRAGAKAATKRGRPTSSA